MKTIMRLSAFAMTFSLFGCATEQQVKSLDEQLKVAVTCPVGFKPDTSYSTTFYREDQENNKPSAKVTTKCVPEDLKTDPKMEWR